MWAINLGGNFVLIREKTFTDLEKTVRANSPHDSTKHFGPELNAEGLYRSPAAGSIN